MFCHKGRIDLCFLRILGVITTAQQKQMLFVRAGDHTELGLRVGGAIDCKLSETVRFKDRVESYTTKTVCPNICGDSHHIIRKYPQPSKADLKTSLQSAPGQIQ